MSRAAHPLYASMGTTIFEAMSRLAAQHGAVNLGQGFPDDRGPDDVLAAAAEALLHGWNQYPSMMGLPELRRAIADHERRFYGLEIDPERQVLVTSGATEALAACLLALLQPGDEAVLFQPFYDAYAPLVRRAGATPRFVTLRPPAFALDEEALAAAITDRTRVIVLNNPLNPAGKLFSDEELGAVARAAERHDLVVVSDEVYEHIVFDGKSHRPLLTLPGMAERCLKIGSAGKTFSLTGWKVGMVVGPPSLITPVARAHQYLTFTTPPNLQVAVARGLSKDRSYFDGLSAELQRRRDRLARGLASLGIEVLPSAGAYFLNFDLRSFNGSSGAADAPSADAEFCRFLVEKVGVAAIPLSAFYEVEPVTHLVRLCFAKQDAVLDAALERLAAYRRIG